MFLLTLLAFGAILGYGASYSRGRPSGYLGLETAEKRMYRLRHDLVMTNVMCEGRIMYIIFLKLGVLLAYLYRI